MADSDSSTPSIPLPAVLSPDNKKENLTPIGSKITELNESRAELLNRIQTLKQDLQGWRSKLDTQVNIYSDEFSDLKKSLNVEVEPLRTNHHDPYYLHASNNSNSILVSPTLNGDNYQSWSRSIRLALSGKNKLGFINGSLLCPTDSEASIQVWIRVNDVVVSWLLNSVGKDISASLLYTDSACEIWNDLKDIFQEENGPRIYQLRRELMNLTQGDLTCIFYTAQDYLGQEMMEYNPKINCSCGESKKLNAFFQRDYFLSFLMGLNSTYAQIVSQILLMDPLPSINKTLSLILQEERKRSIKSVENFLPSESMAFTTFQNDKHIMNQAKYKGKSRRMCTHCGVSGHTLDKCYRLHGFPPGFKFRTKSYAPNSSIPPSAHANLALIQLHLLRFNLMELILVLHNTNRFCIFLLLSMQLSLLLQLHLHQHQSQN